MRVNAILTHYATFRTVLIQLTAMLEQPDQCSLMINTQSVELVLEYSR